jgi:DnaJ-class molecular chaperone
MGKGITDNEEIVMKGEGIKKGNKAGDHYLKVRISIPKTISKK